MQRILSAFRCLASLAVALVATIGPDARAATVQRTFVSTSGDDANACSIAAPCRSFAAAIAKTNTDGEVIVQDSAGYGPLTITKSVSIVAPPGIYAGVSVFAGDGITIDGANINVRLRGLTINGQGGANGINFAQGTSLHVKDCTIAGFSLGGIVLNAAGGVSIVDTALLRNEVGVWVKAGATVTITRATMDRNHSAGLFVNADGANASLVQSTVTNSTGSGVSIQAVAGGLTRLVVDSSLIADNADRGLIVWDNSTSGAVHADITRSTLTRNSEGIGTISSTGSALVSITQNVISDNTSFGVSAGAAGTKVRAAQNTVVRNGTGMQGSVAPALYSPGNNYVEDNTFAPGFNVNPDTLM